MNKHDKKLKDLNQTVKEQLNGFKKIANQMKASLDLTSPLQIAQTLKKNAIEICETVIKNPKSKPDEIAKAKEQLEKLKDNAQDIAFKNAMDLQKKAMDNLDKVMKQAFPSK